MDAAWARVLDVLPDTPEEQIELGFRIVRHAHQQRLRQSEVNASKILERQKSEQDRRTKQMMEERQVVVNERTKLLEENRRCARGGESMRGGRGRSAVPYMERALGCFYSCVVVCFA